MTENNTRSEHYRIHKELIKDKQSDIFHDIEHNSLIVKPLSFRLKYYYTWVDSTYFLNKNGCSLWTLFKYINRQNNHGITSSYMPL